MYQYISSLLLERGFFEVNGNVSKYLGANEYRLLEDDGIISLERDFDGTNAEKNEVLDYIQDLAPRYALTGAHIRGGKLKVYLTKPGEDAEEEATRIDFLIQSIDSGIRKMIGQQYAPVPGAGESPSPVQGRASEILDEEPAPGKTDHRSLVQKPSQRVESQEVIRQEPVRRASLRQKPVYREPSEEKPLRKKPVEDPHEEELDRVRSLPAQDARDYSAREEALRSRSGSRYIPPNQNPNVPGYREPFTVSVIDRRFSFAGFLGSLLGVVLGAILLGAVRALDAPAHYAGFFVPFLVILIYRIMAGHQMPVSLAVLMVLGSLLLGSVLTNAVDIIRSVPSGAMGALRGGVRAHFDNENYFVFNVWIRYGMSVLTAAIPTILLLVGGKKRDIVY